MTLQESDIFTFNLGTETCQYHVVAIGIIVSTVDNIFLIKNNLEHLFTICLIAKVQICQMVSRDLELKLSKNFLMISNYRYVYTALIDETIYFRYTEDILSISPDSITPIFCIALRKESLNF